MPCLSLRLCPSNIPALDNEFLHLLKGSGIYRAYSVEAMESCSRDKQQRVLLLTQYATIRCLAAPLLFRTLMLGHFMHNIVALDKS